MTQEKPFSQSCENNKAPILAVLQKDLAGVKQVLEIGSGTGQHAVYFAAGLPWLVWQPSDREPNIAGICQWLAEAQLPNLRVPLVLDVEQADWPNIAVDAVFSANTSHIMSWLQVQRFIGGVGRLLPRQGLFCLYGPFNYAGQFTSQGNAAFDALLRQGDPAKGLRNIEDIMQLASQAGLELQADHSMPANNRLLTWRKVT